MTILQWHSGSCLVLITRLITVVQALLFSITCLARAAEHLPLTTLELTTIAFIFAMLASSCFWRHKAQNVRKAEVLKTEVTIAQILQEVSQSLQ